MIDSGTMSRPEQESTGCHFGTLGGGGGISQVKNMAAGRLCR